MAQPRVRAGVDRFTVFFDGRELFSATGRTFGGGGRVALWTKADSLTRQSYLTIERGGENGDPCSAATLGRPGEHLCPRWAGVCRTVPPIDAGRDLSRFTGMELPELPLVLLLREVGAVGLFLRRAGPCGAWRVDNDELCLYREVDGLRCFEVWTSAKRVEVRRVPGPLDEGLLRRRQARN